MNLKREFEKLIEKKRSEILEAQKAIASAEAYIQAMLDAIKKLPKEDYVATPTVRPGSDVDKIRDVLLNACKPLHISEIIGALGREDDADTRAKLLVYWDGHKQRESFHKNRSEHFLAWLKPLLSSFLRNLANQKHRMRLIPLKRRDWQ